LQIDNLKNEWFMKKLLLLIVGVVSIFSYSFATTCPGATAIPAAPSLPYTQSLVCGTANDMTSANMTVCGSGLYLGGLESVYSWTPTGNYSGVTIAYTGQTWSGIFLYAGCPTSGGTCVGNITGSGSTKTLNVPGNLNAGTTYYIVFDTWPAPASPCPGTFTINGTLIAPCTAPPTAGSVVAAANPICPSVNNALTITGGTSGTGQTYQWQSSTNGLTYTDIVGATSPSYNANQTAATYYQCVVTCSGFSATTTSVFVTMNSFFNCYCNSAATTNFDEEIYNVTINGGSTNPLYANANGCATAAPGPGSILGQYSNFKTLAPITSAAPGQTVSFSIVQDECDGATYYSNGISMWVDFNQNGLFTDPGEQVFVEATTATGPRTINGTFTVPSNAAIGNTAVRIVCAEGYFGVSLTPCLSYGYGETEDHLINISCPTLAGVTSINTGVCSGSAATLAGTVTNPLSTISWWNAATGGTQVGTGTSFTSPILTANISYWAQEDFSGCPSSARTQVDVTVTAVNVVLTPVDASCNGNDNGSFTQTSVLCGTAPFTYSLDNGVTFGAIPTNLTAGTYFVIVQDANALQSVAYQVIVGQPAAPANLTLVDANYFTADVSWTTTGNETSWNVEVGPTGFTPGTGTSYTSSTTSFTIPGLTENTAYEFYVTPVCGPNPTSSAAGSFSTNAGFLAWDNMCPTIGFVDISSTGTDLNLLDDTEAGVTLPFSFTYDQISMNTLTVGNNGGVVLNTLTGNVGYGGNMTTLAPNYLFLWGDDMDGQTGNVYWEVTGTSPNQVAIVQWDNLNNYFNGAGTVTFQLQIYQATNEIYFVYEDVVFGGSEAADDYAGNADIGVSSSTTDINVSNNNQTYLQNNTCVHFYNALCPNPTNMTSVVLQEQVNLDWTAGAYGETEWTVIYGLAGFDPATSGTILTTTTSDIQITGLNQLTEYDFYVYSECAVDNLTSGGFLVTAVTLPWCADPITLNGTTDVDSIFMTWDWIPVATATNGGISSFNMTYGQTNFDLYANGTELVANGVNFTDSIVDATFLPGQVIDVYVQAVCGLDSSNYVGPFTITMPISNDTVCGAAELMVDGTVYIFNNTGATVTTGETAIVPTQTGYNDTDLPQVGWGQPTLQRTTWFTFTAPASGSMRFSGEDVDAFWSQIAIYDAPLCNDFNTFDLLAASDQATVTITTVGNTTTIDTFKVAPNFTICGLTPGETYYIMHDSWAGATGAATFQGQYSIAMTPITLEAGTFVDVIDACTGTSVVLFDGITGFQPAGAWTAELAPAGTGLTDSLFNTSGLGYQVFNFEYRVTDGCAYDSIVSQVQIFPLSSAGTDGSITVCKNEPVNLLSGIGGNVDLGGSWYNPSNQLMPSSSIIASGIPGLFNYDYITGNGVCPDDTANVLLTVDPTCDYLNVQEMYFSSMTMFPNPTNGLVYITNEGNSEVFNYEVIDIDGRVIATKANAINGASTTTIDLTGKVTGMYMIRVYNGNAEKVFRVVLQ
jgi:hypothetical protein